MKKILFILLILGVPAGALAQTVPATDAPRLSDYAVELDQMVTGPTVPDLKAYAFLRQEQEIVRPGGNAAPEPLIPLKNPRQNRSGIQADISILLVTTGGNPINYRKVTLRDMDGGVPLTSLDLKATCRCINSPEVTTTPYQYVRKSLGLDWPMVFVTVNGGNGEVAARFGLKPLSILNLKPISVAELQTLIGEGSK